MSAASDECDRQPKGKPAKRARGGSQPDASSGGADPVALMRAGFAETKGLEGSCTACLLCLHGDTGVLRAANLGDSGFLILRDGQVFFHSPSQQHRFNMPFQIGPFGEDNSVDQPERTVSGSNWQCILETSLSLGRTGCSTMRSTKRSCPLS